MAVHFEKVVAGFSGNHKYTLGPELRDGSRAVLQLGLRANNASTRVQRTTELLGAARTAGLIGAEGLLLAEGRRRS
jgi:hypothetical protein